MDTVTPEMHEEIKAMVFLLDTDLSIIGRSVALQSLMRERVTRLVETCIAFATEQVDRELAEAAARVAAVEQERETALAQLDLLDDSLEQVVTLVRDYQRFVESGHYARMKVYAPKEAYELNKRAFELLGEENTQV